MSYINGKNRKEFEIFDLHPLDDPPWNNPLF